VDRPTTPSLVRVATFALFARVLVRLRFAHLAGFLERQPAPTAEDAAELARVSALVERVLAPRIPLLHQTCLTRGVTRYRFLRRAGANVQLVFGLAELDGRYQGHCWVVRDGEPYLERPDPRSIFTAVYAIPADGSF